MTNFNILLKELGKTGKAQIILFLMLSYINIYAGFSCFSTVYTTYLPNYRCNISPVDQYIQNESDILNLTTPFNSETNSYDGCYRFNYSLSSCNESLECVDTNADIIPCDQGYTYNRSLFSETVVTEFGLVCNHYYLIPLTTSMYQLGNFFGSFFLSSISDRYGRKRSCMIMVTASLICSCIVTYTTSVIVYMIFRLLSGTLTFSSLLSSFVYVMEISSVEMRSTLGIIFYMTFSFGYLVETITAYKYRNWRDMMLICNITAIPFLLFISILPESPRWLYSVNRNDEAKKIVEKMAKINGKVIKEEVWKEAAETDEDDSQKKKTVTYSALDLFKSKGLRMVSLKLSFVWFSVVSTYYGLALNAGTLAGNIFFNNLTSGVLEICAYGLSVVLAKRLGGRYGTVCGYIICIFSLIASLILTELSDIFPRSQLVSTIFTIFGRVGIVMAYGIIYASTSEIYPTVIRSTGVGINAMAGMIGSTSSSFLISVQIYYRWLPHTVFTVLGLSIQ